MNAPPKNNIFRKVSIFMCILCIAPGPVNILPINISCYQDGDFIVKWTVRAYLECIMYTIYLVKFHFSGP